MQNFLIEINKMTKVRQQAGSRFELYVENLAIEAGRFVAVVGDSGSGKSTLLDILALISRPTSVETFLLHFPKHSFDLKKLWQQNDESKIANIRRHFLGYVLQTGGLLPFLSVRDNLLLPQRVRGGHLDATRLQKTAEILGIAGILSKKPQFLSGGQRQRSAVLRAIAHHPPLLLADEPTAAVDRRRAMDIVSELKQLAKEQQTTVLMVTHDKTLANTFADFQVQFQLSDPNQDTTRSNAEVMA